MNNSMDSTDLANGQEKMTKLRTMLARQGQAVVAPPAPAPIVVPPMVAAAQRLLQLGLHPHWLRAPVLGNENTGKAPISGEWQNAARPQAMDLRTTYKDGNNVGLRTGRATDQFGTGIVVVDLDNTAALDWAREHLPVTPIKAKTGKGEHWYYRYPDGADKITNKGRIKLGGGIEMDLRGDGGQVVAPPSVHYTGAVYAEITPWTEDGIGAMPVFDPAWFPVVAAPRAVNAILSVPTGDEVERVVAARIWLSEESRLDIIHDGEGREGAVFNIATTLDQGFDLPFDWLSSLVRKYNEERIVPPKEDAIVDAKIKNAYQSEDQRGNPRGYKLEHHLPRARALIRLARGGVSLTEREIAILEGLDLAAIPAPTAVSAPVQTSASAPAPAPAPAPAQAPALTLIQGGAQAPAVPSNLARARVVVKAKGEDSETTIQVARVTGERLDLPLRPFVKDGQKVYTHVKAGLTAYFAAALAVELGQAVDPDDLDLNAGEDAPAPAPWPVDGDETERRAWIKAHKTSDGKWSAQTLIEGGFLSLLPVTLVVTPGTPYPSYSWGVPVDSSSVPAITAKELAVILDRPAGVDQPVPVATGEKCRIEINEPKFPFADRPRCDLVAAGIQALAECVYVRDGKVVEVVEDGATAKITNIETPRAQTLLTRCATWIQWERSPADVRKAGGPSAHEVVQGAPGRDLTLSILGEGLYPTLRPLSLVTSAPQFRLDGTAQTQRGYDRATRTFLTASADLPSPGETVSEAVAAAKTLMGLLKDFPFADPPRARAIWLSCLFTRLARASIAGAVPMFASTGNAAGLGKGLLWDVIARIADGQDQPSSTAWQSGERDFKDEIVSTLISAPAMARIDNVPSSKSLDSAALASLLTSYPYYDARGKGDREQGRFEAQTVWCASGIGLRMSTELATRTLEIVIATDDPYHDQRAMPDIEGMAKRDRAGYLHAGLTILRAWHCAGRPVMKSKTIRSNYRAWASIAQQCVLWLASLPGLEGELTDPVAVRVAGATDEDSDMGEFLLIWEQLGANSPATALKAADGWAKTSPKRGDLELEPKVKALRDYLSERCREPSAADLSTILARIKPRTGAGRVIACIDGVKRSLKRTASNGYYVVSAPLPN